MMSLEKVSELDTSVMRRKINALLVGGLVMFIFSQNN